MLRQISFRPIDRLNWTTVGMPAPVPQWLQALLALADGLGGVDFFSRLIVPAALFLAMFLWLELRLSGGAVLIGMFLLNLLLIFDCGTLDQRYGVLAILLGVLALEKDVALGWFVCLGAFATAASDCSLGLPAAFLAFLIASPKGTIRELLMKRFAAVLLGVFLCPDPFSVIPRQVQTPNFHLHPVLLGISLLTLLLALQANRRLPASWRSFVAVAFTLTLAHERFLPMLVVGLASLALLSVGTWRPVRASFGLRLGFGTIAWGVLSMLSLLFVSFSAIIPRSGEFERAMELNGVLKRNLQRVLNGPDVAIDLQIEGIRTFIDERAAAEPARASLQEEYESLSMLRPDWEYVLEKRNFDGAVLPVESALTQVLVEKKGWVKTALLGKKARFTPRETRVRDYALYQPQEKK